MAEKYGFEVSKLRFVQIRQIRTENRSKSRGEIWNRTKNVVPLHCQSMEQREPWKLAFKWPSRDRDGRSQSEDRRAIKMRDTKRDVGHPMQLAASESNTM